MDLQRERGGRSCSPTPSSTTPWSCARSGACGRASTRAPRRPLASLGASRWRAFRDVTWPGHPPGRRVGGGHRLPVHLHLLRRRPHPRRPGPVDARDRDLPADGRPARPAGGVGARAAAAGRGGGDARGARLARAAAGDQGRRDARRRRRRRVRGRGDRAWVGANLALLALWLGAAARGAGRALVPGRRRPRPGGVARARRREPRLAAVRVAARGGRQLAPVRRRSPRCSRWCSAGWRPPRWRARAGRVAAVRRQRAAPPARHLGGHRRLRVPPRPRRAGGPPGQPVARPDRPGGGRAPVRRPHHDAGAALDRPAAARGGRGAGRVAARARGSPSTSRSCGGRVLVAAGVRVRHLARASSAPPS